MAGASPGRTGTREGTVLGNPHNIWSTGAGGRLARVALGGRVRAWPLVGLFLLALEGYRGGP